MIRTYFETDFIAITNIWEKYYKDEFKFDIFLNVLNKAITVENNKIAGIGVVKSIAEVVMMLDKSLGTVRNGKDTIALIRDGILTARLHNYDQVHAFVQDVEFSSILKSHFGFKNTKGEALVLNI